MVMAAGLGTRLRPLTQYLPKPMVPIANRPVLHHLLNLLAAHDVRQIGINLHAFPELIMSYFGDGSALGLEIRWSYEPELLGTAGGTRKLMDFWKGETILVTSGDGLHDIDVTALLGHHRRCGALATIAVKPVDDPSSYGVVVLDRDSRILGFQE
jgi:NDP-sugar pyrophosphorylase family protein